MFNNRRHTAKFCILMQVKKCLSITSTFIGFMYKDEYSRVRGDVAASFRIF